MRSPTSRYGPTIISKPTGGRPRPAPHRIPDEAREYRREHRHEHSGLYHWLPGVGFPADYRRLLLLYHLACGSLQVALYGSPDHVEPLVGCCQCYTVWRRDDGSVCPACHVDVGDHASRRVVAVAGDLVRVFGDRQPKKAKKRATPRKKEEVVVKVDLPAAVPTAEAAKAPAAKRKPRPSRAGAVKAVMAGNKPRGGVARLVAAVVQPGVYGGVRVPTGRPAIGTSVCAVSEDASWTSITSGNLGNTACLTQPNEGLAILTRNATVPLRLLNNNVNGAMLTGLQYNIMFKTPTAIDGAATGSLAYTVDGSAIAQSAEGNPPQVITPLLGYILSSNGGGNTYEPFGNYCPCFCDHLAQTTDSYVYVQPGLALYVSVQSADSEWTGASSVTATITPVAWTRGPPVTYACQTTTFTPTLAGNVTFQALPPGYYTFEFSGTLDSGSVPGQWSVFAAVIGDATEWTAGVSMMEHRTSLSLMNALLSQCSDVRATGVCVTASQVGEVLNRNGAVAFRQFAAEDSWLDLVGSTPSTSGVGETGYVKLASYPDFTQMGLTKGWSAWVKPDDAEGNKFALAVTVDSALNANQIRCPLRDDPWVAVAWKIDDTTSSTLELLWSFGAELVSTDKTREAALSPYKTPTAVAAFDYLRSVPPSMQFTDNPDHFSTFLNLLGGGAKALGDVIGGSAGDFFKGAGGIAMNVAGAAGDIIGMLGNLI